MRFIVEKNGLHNGYDYQIRFFEDGHRCGYVRVPMSHPFYNIKYNHLPIVCHGNLTFSEEVIDNGNDFDLGCWIGFDCAHSNDQYDFKLAREIFGESEIANIMKEFVEEGTNRDMNYVERECLHIIDQLIDSRTDWS